MEGARPTYEGRDFDVGFRTTLKAHGGYYSTMRKWYKYDVSFSNYLDSLASAISDVCKANGVQVSGVTYLLIGLTKRSVSAASPSATIFAKAHAA